MPYMPTNIERSGFCKTVYIGYGRGVVWRIVHYSFRRDDPRTWKAVACITGRDFSDAVVYGRTLDEVSHKINGEV
jgi:hypothetical protein